MNSPATVKSTKNVKIIAEEESPDSVFLDPEFLAMKELEKALEAAKQKLSAKMTPERSARVLSTFTAKRATIQAQLESVDAEEDKFRAECNLPARGEINLSEDELEDLASSALAQTWDGDGGKLGPVALEKKFNPPWTPGTGFAVMNHLIETGRARRALNKAGKPAQGKASFIKVDSSKSSRS